MGAVLVSPKLYSHPSVHALPPRGLGVWMNSLCWLSRNGRGDHFPSSSARLMGATPTLTESLAREGLWEIDDQATFVPQWVTGRWSRRPMQLWKFAPLVASRAKIAPALREAVYVRDGHRCLHCGSAEALSLDHIHPWSLGGEDTFENLQTLCRTCNSRKGARV